MNLLSFFLQLSHKEAIRNLSQDLEESRATISSQEETIQKLVTEHTSKSQSPSRSLPGYSGGRWTMYRADARKVVSRRAVYKGTSLIRTPLGPFLMSLV